MMHAAKSSRSVVSLRHLIDPSKFGFRSRCNAQLCDVHSIVVGPLGFSATGGASAKNDRFPILVHLRSTPRPAAVLRYDAVGMLLALVEEWELADVALQCSHQPPIIWMTGAHNGWNIVLHGALLIRYCFVVHVRGDCADGEVVGGHARGVQDAQVLVREAASMSLVGYGNLSVSPVQYTDTSVDQFTPYTVHEGWAPWPGVGRVLIATPTLDAFKYVGQGALYSGGGQGESPYVAAHLAHVACEAVLTLAGIGSDTAAEVSTRRIADVHAFGPLVAQHGAGHHPLAFLAYQRH